MTNMNSTESKTLTERFVEALSLETQTGEVRWQFEKGCGTPAHCMCEGRELILTPDYSDPEQDAYTLRSNATEGDDTCVLMGCKSSSDTPNQLRNLYQDIADAVTEYNHAPAITQMQVFVRKSAERQCLYSVLDAVKLLHQCIVNNMQGIY